MSVPPIPYSRQATFTQFSTEQFPTTGQGLEAEFNKIAQSIDTTQDRLAEIQRDDGALKNHSVHPDALSHAVRSLLAAEAGVPRGNWAPGVIYQPKDVVAHDGTSYLAATEHTAGASFDADLAAGRWLPISVANDGGSLRVDLGNSTAGKGAALIQYDSDETVKDRLDALGNLRADLGSASAGVGDALVRHTANTTVRDKLNERKSIADFGAQTVFTDNLGFVQAAIDAASRGDEIFIPAGRFNVSAKPDNTKGVRFVGPGQLVAPTPVSQINTYRHNKPIAINKEYLWRVYQVLNNTNREIRCYTYGDSTVEGGLNYIDWGFFLQNLLPDMASARGVQNKFTVINRGVGGSNLSTWSATPDVGVNSANPADLIILKCGINDAFGTDRLELFESRLRNQLAAIRATSGGDVGSLAILLVGPNAVWDMEYDARNTRWFESLRSIFEAAARDYQCAYFDAYAYLQDASFAAGRWLDVPASGPPTGLHPTNVGQSWIWGGVMDFIFGDSELLRFKSNQFHNRSEYRGWPTAKNPPTYYPNNYPPGITWEIALAADGFPITGFLRTDKHADGYLVQTLTPVDGSYAMFVRTSRTNDGTYSDWRGTRVEITFDNGWSNFGGVYRSAAVTLGHDNNITLSGMVKPGTLSANVKIGELPAGYRPVNQHIMLAAADTGPCQLEILSDGDILLKQYTGTPTYVSLSGLTFFP